MSRSDDTDTARSVKGEVDLTPLLGRWWDTDQVLCGLRISERTLSEVRKIAPPHRIGKRHLYDVNEIHLWIASQEG